MTDINYSVYLVTGRNILPQNKEYLNSLEESIKGGVTIVQVREKNLDTKEFIHIAAISKQVCDKYNIPLVINDRVDVALAVGAHGVHLGQDDMSVEQARKLLPPGSIIGLSCNTVEHVQQAVKDDVDCIGIGAVWDTQTKRLTRSIVGVRGVGEMLEVLDGTKIKAVAIGGIKSANLLRTLHGSVSSTNHALDGVAIVSDIVAAPDPEAASKRIQTIFSNFHANFLHNPAGLAIGSQQVAGMPSADSVLSNVANFMREIRERNPLIHQITNAVVATQSANITLAVGASPIMATEPLEMDNMSKICGALLVNIGTMGAAGFESMMLAGTAANKYRKPIVFDPVGVGASDFRKGSVKTLLNTWQASVIKGNAGELAAMAGTTEVESKGVDSVGPGFKDPAAFVKNLAKRERCVVVLTGSTDYISDGVTVAVLQNGDNLLGQITGSGCILGSIIASYCATATQLAHSQDEGSIFRGDMFGAAVTAVLVLTVAAELAAKRNDVKGPGTFLPGLVDVLWKLTPEDVLKAAKITIK